jgi:hypothetical protein
MSIKHASEESARNNPTSRILRGAKVSIPEDKVSGVIDIAPVISSVTNVGCTAYVTFSHTPTTGGIATSFTATSSPGNITATVTDKTKPIIVTGLTANTSYTFTVTATNSVSQKTSSSSSSITTTVSSVTSNQSATDLYTVMTTLANSVTTSTPTAGGTLTLNGVSLGSYDYVIKRGNQTISTFTNSDWFTNTADTRSALIVVDGDLTINRLERFIPSNRKLFTCIYVTGNLINNGQILMTDRGANHSATAAGNIRLHTGTFTGVTNPQIPASGGAGGGTVTRSGPPTGTTNANPGSAGTNGGTGGGSGGCAIVAGDATGVTVIGGSGSAGTSFTGGGGGGSIMIYASSGTLTSGNAVANGGAGGNAGPSYTYGASGGVGNPAGSSSQGGTQGSYPFDAGDGTAGSLCIFVLGELRGQGLIQSNGHSNMGYQYNQYMQCPGGSGGGGSVTIFYKYDNSLITPTANGGKAPGQGDRDGGGGAGTARKLALP